MNIIATCLGAIKRMLSFNVLKTLYINFKLFPFEIARKLPLKIYYNVDIQIDKGGVRFRPGTEIQRFMVSIGDFPYPMSSLKGSYTYIRISPTAKLILGKDITIRNGANIVVGRQGCMTLGDGVLINSKTLVYSNMQVDIEDNVRISWNVQIMDSDFHFVYNENKNAVKYCSAPVVIGKNSWIGNHTIVCKGTKIPPYSILSSGSLINKDFSLLESKGNLFVGRPAVLKQTGIYRIFDERKENELFSRFQQNNFETIYLTDAELTILGNRQV